MGKRQYQIYRGKRDTRYIIKGREEQVKREIIPSRWKYHAAREKQVTRYIPFVIATVDPSEYVDPEFERGGVYVLWDHGGKDYGLTKYVAEFTTLEKAEAYRDLLIEYELADNSYESDWQP